MNNVILIGRLTKDPEVRYSEAGNAVARFTLAVNRDKSNSDFIGITCFGKTAELAEKYLKKGKQIGMTGRIQTGSYEKDGKKVYTTDVIADRVEFLGGKEEKEEKEVQQKIPEGFSQLDDDIPF